MRFFLEQGGRDALSDPRRQDEASENQDGRVGSRSVLGGGAVYGPKKTKNAHGKKLVAQ